MCVLVVLVLVGLMALQTTQALSSSRRTLMKQVQIRQARELIEYAILRGRRIGFEDSVQLVPLDSSSSLTGQVTIQRIQNDSSSQRVRIVASYPFGNPSAVTVSSEIDL